MAYIYKVEITATDTSTFGTNSGLEDDSVFIYASILDQITIVETWDGNDKIYIAFSGDGVSNGYNFEIRAGSGDDLIYGSTVKDVFYDQDGNDYFTGRSGDDIVYVGFGDDIYDGSYGNDTISFYIYYDDEYNGITLDLQIRGPQDFNYAGIDTIRSFENAFGSFYNDTIYGSSVNNAIYGVNGNDVIYGRSGNDTLYGENGADRLIGGAGQDFIYLAEEAPQRDVIAFELITDSGATTATADQIVTFDKGGGANNDKIDLSAIDASVLLSGNNAFTFLGTSAITTSTAGEVRLVVSGATTFVYVDNDADTAPEMVIRVVNVTGLTAADFVL